MAKRTKKTKAIETTVDEGAMMALIEQAEAFPVADEMPISDQVDDEAMMAIEAVAVEELEADEAPAEVIEDAVLELEALDAVLEVEATEEPVSRPQAFDDILATIDQSERQAAAVAITQAVDMRADYERINGNPNIQKALDKARKEFSFPSTAAVLMACSVDEAFVNRSVHDGKRYNVYAFAKLSDVAQALAAEKGVIRNAINFAIIKSLLAAHRAGVVFTGEVAKMAASDKIRVQDANIKAILTRHSVAAVTAPTQASSTMQALETLGIVRVEGSRKNPTYILNDNPAVTKLQEVMAA